MASAAGDGALKSEGSPFKGALLISWYWAPIFCSSSSKCANWKMTPIEPVIGRLAGDDMVGPERRHIGGGGAEPVDHRDDRLFLRGVTDRSIKRLAAARRAAAGIDVNHDRLDGARARRLVDQIDRVGPRGDEAVDLDLRHLAAAGRHLDAALDLQETVDADASATTIITSAVTRQKLARLRRRRRSRIVSVSIA